jgi:hypothetical protein
MLVLVLLLLVVLLLPVADLHARLTKPPLLFAADVCVL